MSIEGREYIPGDSLKFIHWKKTISRPLPRPFVKEYSGQAAGSSVVLADLRASNYREFSELVYLTVSMVIKHFSEAMTKNVVLVLVTPNKEVLRIRGTLGQMLTAIIGLFERGVIRLDWDYESYGEPAMEDTVIEMASSPYKILRDIYLTNKSFSEFIDDVLSKENIEPPSVIVLVNGKPTETFYSIAKVILKRKGFKIYKATELRPEHLRALALKAAESVYA